MSIYVINNSSQELPLLLGIYFSLLPVIFSFIENRIVKNYNDRKTIYIIKYGFIGAISFAIFSGGFFTFFYDRIQQQFWGVIVYLFGCAALFFVSKLSEKIFFERLLAFELKKISLSFNRDYPGKPTYQIEE